MLPPLLKDGSQLMGHALLSWSRRVPYLFVSCWINSMRTLRAGRWPERSP